MTEVQETKNWLWKDIDWKKATQTDIEKVIKAGGDVNDVSTTIVDGPFNGLKRVVDCVEHTPLELAVKAQNVTAVECLLKYKADPNIVLAKRWNEPGNSKPTISDFPLFLQVIATKNKEIINLFFQYGVNPYVFNPSTQKPKKVLENHPSSKYINTDEYLYSWENHPLTRAIEINNLEALKKMTSDPYIVPKECIEGIDTRNYFNINPVFPGVQRSVILPKTEQYWEAFIDQYRKAERRGLRKKLAEVCKRKETSKKEELVTKLSRKSGGLFSKSKLDHADSQRDNEARMYKDLRIKFNSEIAREARKVLQKKRDKLLGK